MGKDLQELDLGFFQTDKKPAELVIKTDYDACFFNFVATYKRHLYYILVALDIMLEKPQQLCHVKVTNECK